MSKTESAITNYMKGRIPLPDTLLEIYNLTGCSVHWLLTGEGSMKVGKHHLQAVRKNDVYPVFLGEAEREIVGKLANISGHTIEEEIRNLMIESLAARGLIHTEPDTVELVYFGDQIPKLIPMKVLGLIAAGRPIEVFEYEETALIAEEFAISGRNTYVLRVKGDSMIDDNIQDGDLIICYEAAEAYNGQTVVALIDGDKATVKKFYQERGIIRLQPANSAHKPILLEPDRVRIQGIVIGIQRRP